MVLGAQNKTCTDQGQLQILFDLSWAQGWLVESFHVLSIIASFLGFLQHQQQAAEIRRALCSHPISAVMSTAAILATTVAQLLG